MAGGPVAMVLTVLVGILVNNAVTGAKITGLERGLKGEIDGFRAELKGEINGIKGEMNGLRGEMNGLNSKIDGAESRLKFELQRVEGVLGAKLDG